MKTTLKFFALTVALFGITNIAFAQNTDSATADAGARIITPITITNDEALEFGDIVAGANAVTVSAAGARTATNGDLLLSVGRTPQAAQFTVTGEGSLNYSIVIDASATLTETVGGTATMTISTFTHNATETLSAAGQEVFSVGATLTVGASQASGIYEGEFEVTVTYD